jgi:hypothetical protein
LQGTYAGAGDIVQGRLNGWHLAQHGGNRRGPINRENYRVLATDDRGGMTVTPLGATASEEGLGERITLPPDYVADHLALGYASTVHAVQGVTVDTSHSVITGQTGVEALYVGMSRGREANTAYVATRTVPADPAHGTEDDGLHRNPTAVLADTLEGADSARSALAAAVESAQDAENVRTPAERLADAIELATSGRTARWLDELVDTGQLRADQRAQLAAEDGAASLSRLLRRAELAGHDPREVLTDAIDERPLEGARQLTNVIHHRITASDLPLDPIGETYTDWIPAVDDPEWRQYLSGLAETADTRRHELGQQVATEQPQWAIEAFGPPPQERKELAEWQANAATVATHRELTAHEDPETAIGAAPKPGQVDEYTSWRAAWRALGRPEADRDELEMSDGQLRVRIRAYEREKTWAPPYVADELAGITQAAEQHRATAVLRRAEAVNSADPDQQARLDREATETAALAETLDRRAEQLTTADEARAEWYAHTAETRAAKDRAQAELSARHVDDEQADEPVTADEWLAAQRDESRAEDPHREITDEAALADVAEQRTHDRDDADLTIDHARTISEAAPEEETRDGDRHRDLCPHDPSCDDTQAAAMAHSEPFVETNVPDVRDLAAEEPAPPDVDGVRTPSAEETADSIGRAQRALAEIQQRRTVEQREAAETARTEQLTRWHADDTVGREVSVRQPALEVGVSDG